MKDAAFGPDLRYRLLHGGIHHRRGKSLSLPLGVRLDCVSHIGERVNGERANFGESDRGIFLKTSSVVFGVYIPGIKIDYELLVSKSSSSGSKKDLYGKGQ